MSKIFPEQREPSTAPETSYAAEGELIDADEPLLGGPSGEFERDQADREPGTFYADDAVNMDVSAQPRSEITAGFPDSGYDETLDGLSDIEETLRQQAEDRVTGDDEDFVA